MFSSRRSLAPALLVLLVPTLVRAQHVSRVGQGGTPPSSVAASDEAAFRAFLRRADDAWNARDAGRWSQLFTRDVDFTLEGANTHVIGRDSLRLTFAASFARTAPELRHRTTLDHLQLIEPNLALADIHVAIERLSPDSSRTPVRSYAGNIVSVRGASGWHSRLVRLRLLAPDSAMAFSDARRKVDEVNARWVAAFNAGDVAASAKVYAPDAMVMPSNSAAISGRSAIQQFWQGGWGMGIRNVKLTTDELAVHDDMATEVGRYHFDVNPSAGPAGGDHGKYIVIWKRSPTEGWQWYRDIFNSDVAVAAASR